MSFLRTRRLWEIDAADMGGDHSHNTATQGRQARLQSDRQVTRAGLVRGYFQSITEESSVILQGTTLDYEGNCRQL